MRVEQFVVALTLLIVCDLASAQGAHVIHKSPLGPEHYRTDDYKGHYIGHDEPLVGFYSNIPGSGNSSIWKLVLPKDPPTLPRQDGTGGTFSFMTDQFGFWVGMALCDDQSSPNPGGSSGLPNVPCKPDSDSNILDNPDPTAPDYIGKHPGIGYLELTFAPPGWVLFPAGNSCDAIQWCAFLLIAGATENANTGQSNNAACLNAAGLEPLNWAFVTKSGVPHAPASPLLATLDTLTAHAETDLFMNSGDTLIVRIHDTPNGVRVEIDDITSGQKGSMTASAANGFGELLFDPNGTSCDPSTHNIPTNFHPAYSTSSERTLVPWAALGVNVAFDTEIGHFEYCNAVDAEGGNCIQDGVHDFDATTSGIEDDTFCYDSAASSLIAIGGCFQPDSDFDAVTYQKTWPGTLKDVELDRLLHPRPARFTSPLFIDHEGEKRNYSRAAFATDMPAIEADTVPPCDISSGSGCTNPPVGAAFYPLYTTTLMADGTCMWQFGGPDIPGTVNSFGGTSTTEYGPLLQRAFPFMGTTYYYFEEFLNVLDSNPCPAEIP